jgi:3-oxoacyl-[acyl-carrier-protein] synthase-3
MTESIGIVSYGLYLPEGRQTAGEIALQAGLSVPAVADLGIRAKCLPAASDQPVPMAVRAADRAFAAGGGITPGEVDVVIWTGEEYKDYIAQTAAIRIQEELGCRSAWAFDLVGQGVTLVQGLRLARDLILGDPEVSTVLLAGGTRNLDLVDARNPATRFLLASSASGGALLVRRNHPQNLLLGTAFHVDADMADEVYVPGGGTEFPFSPENLGSELMFFQVAHPERVADYLARRWPKALADTAREAAGGAAADYLALRHLAPVERRQVLKDLHLDEQRSIALCDYGCHGVNDVVLSLDLGLAAGRVRAGSLVVLAAGGIGFGSAAAAIRWGPTAAMDNHPEA